MTDLELQVVLSQVTGRILAEMQSKKWHPRPDLPSGTIPCAWDINDGWCEDWAMEAARAIGLDPLRDPVWLDEIDPRYGPDAEDACAHVVLVLRRGDEVRFYDAQHPDGVARIEDLDIVRGVTREDFLARRTLKDALLRP